MASIREILRRPSCAFVFAVLGIYINPASVSAAEAADGVPVLARITAQSEIPAQNLLTLAASGTKLVGGTLLRSGFDTIGPLHVSHGFGRAAQQSRQRAPAAKRQLGVFGSIPVAFSAIPAKRRWLAAYGRFEGNTLECRGACAPGATDLRLEIEAARDASLLEKLAIVDGAVNDFVTYVPDRNNYGQLDHWASPEETLRRAKGDCEDYAILKMSALVSLGIPSTSMSVVVLLDRRRHVYHAVLAVSTSDGHFILDNLSRTVRRDSEIPDYQPLFSFSGEKSWIHGAAKDTRVASAPVGLAGDVRPGEGPAAESSSWRDATAGIGLLGRI